MKINWWRVGGLVVAPLALWAIIIGVAHAEDERGLLRRINAEVNAAIEYEAEPKGRGDVVLFGPKRGDCEDYAETKRLRLIVAGWPRRALAVRGVTVRQGGGCHAVLVATDRQGRRWVLDNRTSWVETVEQTGRRYVWNDCY